MFSYLLLLFALLTAVFAQSGLPDIGTEYPLSMLAKQVPVRIRTELVSVDFSGSLKIRVEENPNDKVNSVLLKVDGFHMNATLPGKDGSSSGGTIAIEQNDVDVDPKSTLKLTHNNPPKYENILELSFTMTIKQPDLMLRKRELLELVTKDPAKLIGSLTQFPPKGKLYQLQNPVDLVSPDDPDTVIATIEKFPVNVGGL
ncbi:hypothetical protein GQ42DRAFT_156477 [Ramicandelaber brevisporus]|nr:hypothetical protein GQ42DRAFT_156477 [Ramicandelaber brevisporus]